MMNNMRNFLAMALAAMTAMAPSTVSAYYSYGGYNNWWNTYRSSYNYSAPRTVTTAATSTSTGQSSVEQTLLTLANQERAKHGLNPLQADSQLADLARMKSQDMASKHYFSHNSPTYGTPAQMLSRHGVRYNLFGENIAQGNDAYRIHSMWMASAQHRANILNASFTHVGMGAVSGTATQLFIAR